MVKNLIMKFLKWLIAGFFTEENCKQILLYILVRLETLADKTEFTELDDYVIAELYKLIEKDWSDVWKRLFDDDDVKPDDDNDDVKKDDDGNVICENLTSNVKFAELVQEIKDKK